MKSKVYIIIVTFNGLQWLQKCLDSTFPYPVIIIDNYSTDGTPQFIKTNYPEAILFEQNENLGFGKANNIGISHALKLGADFVFLLNQDAYLFPDTIEKLVTGQNANPDYGVLSPIHLNGKGDRLDRNFSHYVNYNANPDFYSDFVLKNPLLDVYGVPFVNAAGWLISKNCLETVGGFDPVFFHYGEDDNYCQRVLYHGFKIGICPNTFIRHDSNHHYHGKKKKGSKEYYSRFLNKVKVEYANVNRADKEALKDQKKKYLQDAFKSLIKFDLREMKINLHKRKLIRHLDFSEAIKEGRKKGGNYLDNSSL